MRHAFVLLALLVTGCPAAPCTAQCEDDASFWLACWDVLAERGIAVVCYDDPAGLGESLATAGESADARAVVYDAWADAGKVHDCASPEEVVSHCQARTIQEFRFMEPDIQEARRTECIDQEGSDAAIAFANDDCEGFLEAVGL